TVPELLHQAQEGIGATFSRGARAPPARVVSFVQHDQVPRFRRLADFGLALATSHEMTRRDDRRLTVPFVPTNHLALAPSHRRRGIPVELAPVVDRPVQVELLTELDLPLLHHRGGCEDED